MILVTGAAGYIGSMTVHHLHRLYDQPKVIGVDNLSRGYTCNLPKDFICMMGDVNHPEFIRNIIRHYKVKHIIHCAAYKSVPESIQQPLSYYRNNLGGTQNLIEIAIGEKVEGFVLASSSAVYGEPDLCAHRAFREDDPTRPMSPYGWSKLMAEQMLRDAYIGHGLSSVILRYFNVAGADPLGQTGDASPKDMNLIKALCNQQVLGMPKQFLVHGDDYPTPDGTCIRDYVHVEDVADANCKAWEYVKHHNGCLTLNVGRGEGHSVTEIIRAVEDCGEDQHWMYARRREGDPARVVADISLIRDRLAWRPDYGIHDMAEHALRWEKSL